MDEAGGELAGAVAQISDGRQTLTAPAGARLPMPLGDWTVRVAVAGYVTQERRVTVAGGSREQPVREVVQLVREVTPPPPLRPGYLRVNYPTGSPVPGTPFVVTPQGGGAPIQGRTGQDLELPPGRWNITLSRPLGTISRRVQIREGRRTTVNSSAGLPGTRVQRGRQSHAAGSTAGDA